MENIFTEWLIYYQRISRDINTNQSTNLFFFLKYYKSKLENTKEKNHKKKHVQLPKYIKLSKTKNGN